MKMPKVKITGGHRADDAKLMEIGDGLELQGLHEIQNYAHGVIERYFLGSERPMNVVFLRRDADPVEIAVLMMLREHRGRNPNANIRDVVIPRRLTPAEDELRQEFGIGISSTGYSRMSPEARREWSERQSEAIRMLEDKRRQCREIIQKNCEDAGVFDGDTPGNPIPIVLVETGFVGEVPEGTARAIQDSDGKKGISGRDIELCVDVGKMGGQAGIRRHVMFPTNLTIGETHDSAIEGVEALEEFPKDMGKPELRRGRDGRYYLEQKPASAEHIGRWRDAYVQLTEYINPSGKDEILERLKGFSSHSELRDYLIGTLNLGE